MIRLLLALALAAPAAAAPTPLQNAVVGAAVSPTDPFSRLRLGQALARTEGRSDEAVAVLSPLLSDPRHHYAAAESLAVLLLERPPRSPWLDAVNGVLAHPDFADSQRLLAWRARALAREATTLDAALAQTAALIAAHPEDIDVLTARAEVLLRADRAAEALAALTGQRGAALAPLRAAALVGVGRHDRARKLAGSAMDGCEGSRTPAPCAAYVEGLGFDALARGTLTRALEDDLGAPGQSQVLGALGQWRQALDLDPDNDAARVGLALSLLDAGNPGAAQAVVSADSALQSTIFAVELVSDRPTLAQVDRAMALDPDHPRVLAAAARVYAGSRKWTAALDAVERLLVLNPADRETIGLAIDVGLAAQREDVAVGAVRGGLGATERYEDWRALSADLANLLAALAEALKSDEDLDGATANYLVAHAMEPDDPDLMMGLGGVLWDSDRLDPAEAILRVAAEHPSVGLTPTLLLVELLHSRGRTEDAQAMLREAGLSDARARELERQLAASLAAQAALNSETPEDALRAYEALLAEDPKNPQLHHELGNALMSLRLHDEALDAFTTAQALDPSSPWSALGRVNALLSLGDVAGAEAALVDFPLSRKPKVLHEKARVERRLLQARADQLRAQRRDRDAFAVYEALLDASKRDTWALTGLAELYMLHQQYGVARVFFEEAAEVAPSNNEAWSGQIRARIAMGEYDEAEELLATLEARGIPVHALRSELRLRQTIAAADRAALYDPFEALELLEDELSRRPAHPDLVAAWARVQTERSPGQAFVAASSVLEYQDPYHEASLGAAVTAAGNLGDPERAIPLLDAALEGAVGDWVRWARDSVALQGDLLEVSDQYAAGDHQGAKERLAHIELVHLGDMGDRVRQDDVDLPRERSELEEVHRLQLIGGMWLTLNEPDRALPLFEEARALNPRDPDTMIGLAGALEALGLTGRATQQLNQHWAIYSDPKTGEALIQLQARRGRHQAAEGVAQEVARRRFTPMYRDDPASPEPLPMAALPEGRELEVDATPGPWRLLTPEELEALHASAADRDPIDGEAGMGWIWRPDPPDADTELRALIVPVGAEIAPADPVRVMFEAMPVWVTNGQTTQTGASVAAGLATPWAGSPVAVRGSMGLTPVGFDAGPTWTGLAMLNVRPVRGVEARLTGTRSPVPQSLLSWAGEQDDDGEYYGRVSDSWLTALATGYTPSGLQGGVAGRWGTLDGLQIAAPVAWRQVQGWGSAAVWRKNAVDLRLGLDAQYLTHDTWIGGFEPGQGGVFTPERYFAGVAQGELYWQLPADAAAFCAGADIGPQYIAGVPDADDSWRPGSRLTAAARISPSDRWHIMLGYSQQSVWAGWQQNTTLLQLRYGERASRAWTPGATTSSAVHGLPFQEPGSCWDRVAE